MRAKGSNSDSLVSFVWECSLILSVLRFSTYGVARGYEQKALSRLRSATVAFASCFSGRLSGTSSDGGGTRPPNAALQVSLWLAGVVKNADMCKWDYALAARGSKSTAEKPAEVNDVLLEASRRVFLL